MKSKDGAAVTLVYDGDGNRVAKTVGSVTTKYLVDDLNPTGYLQVMEEVSAGTVQVAYTYGTKLVSQTRQPGVGAVTSYYGWDAHGSVAFLTSASGVVTDAYDYDAWGGLVESTGATQNSRLFASEEVDPDLGLINLRARQYSSATGRFASRDPLDRVARVDGPGTLNVDSRLREAGTGPHLAALVRLQALPTKYRQESSRAFRQSLYLYADSDPVNLLDPSGLDTASESGGFYFNISTALRRLRWVGGSARCMLIATAYLMEHCRELDTPADVAECAEGVFIQLAWCKAGKY
jgi:RHS repeat-associated protein